MKHSHKHNTYSTLIHWHNFKLKLVIEGIAVGLLSGLIVVLYRYLLEKVGGFTQIVYFYLSRHLFIIPAWLILLALVGYTIGRIVRFEPMAGGSGIPQVEGYLLRKLNMSWWRIILAKFAGGILAIGGGLSLGREGPSIQIGAAVGQGFAKVLKRVKLEEKFLITCGASAGLSAAFNAPIAGVMFALEEIHKNFSPLVLVSAMTASMTADFISKEFFGLKPVFDFKQIAVLPLNLYGYIIMLGIIVGIFGALFNSTLISSLRLYARQKWLPQVWKPVIPLLVACPLGIFLPQVLGGGHNLIQIMVKDNVGIWFLVILLAAKFFFTMISYGSGAPGGIFLPLLVIGALTGSIYGSVITDLAHLNSSYINSFMILAMAGYFTAIVKAPITGSLLITEMTGSFEFMLPLAAVSVTAYVISDIIGSKPIYEVLLDRMIKGDTYEKFTGDSHVKVIIESAVHMGSMVEGKKVKELTWPSKCLLVGLKRGAKEIIPKGETSILAGDLLIILTDEDYASKVLDEISKMTVRV